MNAAASSSSTTRPKTVEFLKFDKSHQLQHCGPCSLQLNEFQQSLIIARINEEEIYAAIHRNFYRIKNILISYGPKKSSDIILVFSDEEKCSKLYDGIVKMRTDYDVCPFNEILLEEMVKDRIINPMKAVIRESSHTRLIEIARIIVGDESEDGVVAEENPVEEIKAESNGDNVVDDNQIAPVKIEDASATVSEVDRLSIMTSGSLPSEGLDEAPPSRKRFNQDGFEEYSINVPLWKKLKIDFDPALADEGSYDPSQPIRIVVCRPHYELIEDGKKLVIYPTLEKSSFYYFSQNTENKKYSCDGCKEMNKIIEAEHEIYLDGTPFIVLDVIEHSCQPIWVIPPEVQDDDVDGKELECIVHQEDAVVEVEKEAASPQEEVVGIPLPVNAVGDNVAQSSDNETVASLSQQNDQDMNVDDSNMVQEAVVEVKEEEAIADSLSQNEILDGDRLEETKPVNLVEEHASESLASFPQENVESQWDEAVVDTAMEIPLDEADDDFEEALVETVYDDLETKNEAPLPLQKEPTLVEATINEGVNAKITVEEQPQVASSSSSPIVEAEETYDISEIFGPNVSRKKVPENVHVSTQHQNLRVNVPVRRNSQNGNVFASSNGEQRRFAPTVSQVPIILNGNSQTMMNGPFPSNTVFYSVSAFSRTPTYGLANNCYPTYQYDQPTSSNFNQPNAFVNNNATAFLNVAAFNTSWGSQQQQPNIIFNPGVYTTWRSAQQQPASAQPCSSSTFNNSRPSQQPAPSQPFSSSSNSSTYKSHPFYCTLSSRDFAAAQSKNLIVKSENFSLAPNKNRVQNGKIEIKFPNGFTYFYIYYSSLKKFICQDCKQRGENSTALLGRHSSGELYVLLDGSKHACTMPFVSDSLLYGGYDFIQSSFCNSLIIYNPMNMEMGIEFQYSKHSNKYICKCCEKLSKLVTAKKCIDANGRECIAFNSSHACSLINMVEKGIVIKTGHFRKMKISNGEEELSYCIFVFQDPAKTYKFINDPDQENTFFCENCKALGFDVCIKFRQNQNGEGFLLKCANHLCNIAQRNL